jgi:uncharacterized protein YdhG (YjbR/CyaY superfamily)
MKQVGNTPDELINNLPEDRKNAMTKLREVIIKNLPPNFSEGMGYGMIGYAVPHSVYPPGYHCDPKLPLPFISIANQKNFIALYHMGMYAKPELLQWFQEQYTAKVPSKLDMGKSCVRFKKVDQIPYELIGELVSKMSAEEWIATYESAFRKK